MTTLERALAAPKNLTADEIAALLGSADEGLERDLFAAAREVKRRCGKTETLPRGLIECSNICTKDCLYCGIRRGNAKAVRYRLSVEEALACVDEARRRGYPAVAFQAGEIEGEANTAYYEALLAGCRGLEVTLSLGEQTEAVYRRWKEAGALRYLIRIETSNRALYSKIHPDTCSFDRRVGCIRTLKKLGYVTGTGVMIGLPGQTVADLANDVVFFGGENVDMVGMGPYVPHAETPMGKNFQSSVSSLQSSVFSLQSSVFSFQSSDVRLQLALRMIAVTRIYLQNVNIVAATALEALDPAHGRDRGIEAGANVIMPNLTPPADRRHYDLYPGKFQPPSNS